MLIDGTSLTQPINGRVGRVRRKTSWQGPEGGESARSTAATHAANAHLLDASVDVSHAGVDLALHLTVQPVGHGVASHGDGPLSVVAANAYRSCHGHLKK